MGAVAAIPLIGKLALGAIGGLAVAKSGAFGSPQQPPPPITSLPENQQIANQYKPINFASIMDELSGDRLEIVRGVDNRVSLNFANSRGRINLDEPANINLPAVRQIRGRAIDERAAEVIALSSAMTRLGNAIEQMETTSPYLIPQNQELINSYRTAVTGALDRGFDFKQQAIDQKLTKMGLANSSTAMGVQIALAREKATAYAESELKQAELAQNLKQQALGNLNQRGQLLNAQANTELNRFATETSNQLQLRGQDMQADLATQTLEQQRSMNQNILQLEQAGLKDKRRAMMLQAGADLFNGGNQSAINARQVDNNALTNANTTQLAAFNSRPRDPMKELLYAGVGAGIGSFATQGGSMAFNSLFGQEKIAPWADKKINF
jgi:hypothetical protein